jgi:hypothetical protein
MRRKPFARSLIDLFDKVAFEKRHVGSDEPVPEQQEGISELIETSLCRSRTFTEWNLSADISQVYENAKRTAKTRGCLANTPGNFAETVSLLPTRLRRE